MKCSNDAFPILHNFNKITLKAANLLIKLFSVDVWATHVWGGPHVICPYDPLPPWTDWQADMSENITIFETTHADGNYLSV